MKDISVTKLNLIADLVNLNDETILTELSNIILKHKTSSTSGNPLSEEDIITRALQSNKDYEQGKYVTQEQLELDSKKW